jgi:hypothetical protein
MSGVLVLGIVVSIIAALDLLAAIFGADTRPDLGIGHPILS